MRSLLVVLCFLFAAWPSWAMKSLDTVRARISDEVVLKYSFLAPEKCDAEDLSVEFFMHNPTLFFPDSVKAIGADTEGLHLARLNDSLYRINARISADSGSVITFELYGEALMANSDTASLCFRNARLGNKPLPRKEYFLVVQGDYGELPYYRYPKFLNIYPSPCAVGSTLTWRIMADQPGQIKFYLVNLVGARDLVLETTLGEPGVYDYEYSIQSWIPAGLYYLVLESKFGFTQKKIEIVK